MPLFGKKKDKKAKKEVKAKKVNPKKAKAEEKKSKKPTNHAAPRKATEKITPQKVNSKKSSGVVEKKSSKNGVKVLVPEKDTGKRVYHVSKRPDGKWAVKFAGGEKAIKLFKTPAEAVEYTKEMSKNQDGVMHVHNSKGKNKGRIQ